MTELEIELEIEKNLSSKNKDEWVHILEQYEMRDCKRCKKILPDPIFWIKPQNERQKCRGCIDEVAIESARFKDEFPEKYQKKKEQQQARAAKIRCDPEMKYKNYHLARLKAESFKDDFTKDEFIRLFYTSGCYYCGYSNNDIVLCGADRLDGSKGYIRGNLLPACKTCNNMKGTLPLRVFIKQSIDITKQLKNNPYVDILDLSNHTGDPNIDPKLSIRGGARKNVDNN